MKEIVKGITPIDLAAHNEDREHPTGNELYNKAHGLGTHHARMVLQQIAGMKHGFLGGPLTKRDVITLSEF